jgi:hypothetical protein
MALSVKARRAAVELEHAIHEADCRRVIELVDNYGLSAGDRIATARELHRRARDPEEAELVFGAYDLARVWYRGQT